MIMKSLLMYPKQKEVSRLLGRICEHFPNGYILADIDHGQEAPGRAAEVAHNR